MENNSSSIRGQFFSAKPLLLFLIGFAIFVPVMTLLIIIFSDCFGMSETGTDDIWGVLSLIIAASFVLIGLLCFFAVNKSALEIDDSGIHGKKLFGKPFTIPVESLRRVSETSFSGIVFTDSLGKKHSVRFLKNRTELCVYMLNNNIEVFNTVVLVENAFAQSVIHKKVLSGFKLFAKISLILSTVFGVISGFWYASNDNWFVDSYTMYPFGYPLDYPFMNEYYEPFELPTTWIAIFFLLVCIITIILYNMTKDCTLTANNKFITGRTLFGKAVTIPLDSVSSVSAKKFFNCIKIVSNGKSKSFLALENYLDLHRAISEKINVPKVQPIVLQAPVIQRTEQAKKNETGDTIKELKEYKELLEQGIISEEEFSAKKKQILGI